MDGTFFILECLWVFRAEPSVTGAKEDVITA
jgi:hypothetical protein